MGDEEADDLQFEPPSRLSDIRQLIRRYRISQFLGATNEISRRNASQRARTPYRASRPVSLRGGHSATQELLFGPWTLAFLAKHVILASSEYRGDITAAQYVDLIALHGNLEDPIIEETDPLSGFRFLFRTAWEQFTFQESPFHLLPRYFLLLKSMSELDADSKLNIPAAWQDLTGMSLEDFMVLGFGFYSLAATHSIVDARALKRTTVESLRARGNSHSDTVLSIIAADYERFRAVQSEYAIADSRYAKAEFNALRKFPLIRTGRYDLIAPIPALVMERVTSGIYYDLLDAHGEAFTRQFGRQFEIYVGELLIRAYGADAVTTEPVYDRGQRRGPDWSLRCGSTLIVFECTSSGTRMATRTAADLEEMLWYVGKVFQDRIQKFEKKITDIWAGVAGVDVTGIEKIIPVVLTHERIYLEPAIKAFLREALGAEFDLSEFVFMDVGDLEVVTSWSDRYDLAQVIEAWRQDYPNDPQSIGLYANKKSREEGLPYQNPLLKETMDEFFTREVITDTPMDAGGEESMGASEPG